MCTIFVLSHAALSLLGESYWLLLTYLFLSTLRWDQAKQPDQPKEDEKPLPEFNEEDVE
jgi:hypothetical protein